MNEDSVSLTYAKVATGLPAVMGNAARDPLRADANDALLLNPVICKRRHHVEPESGLR
jgi:hypothetical protein